MMDRTIKAILLAFTLAMVGCGGDSPTSPSQASFVQFRLDANSCGAVFGSRSLTFTFFVDGNQVGTGSLGIGTTSAQFRVIAGSHVASASVTNTALRWMNLSFTVAPQGTFTYILIC